MNKKLEINIGKKPDIVFQFDQFLNVEQAVDKFINKKGNLEKLIAPLLPKNIEETIQKLIPEVNDGYTPQKGVDYDDGKDWETPSEEKIVALIEPRIPKPIKWDDGKTPKKWIDYFTKQELQEIKKALKESILAELPKRLSDEEINIKFDGVYKSLNASGGAMFLRQLRDVNVGTPDELQYWLTYNKARQEFALTQITWWGGGTVDTVVAGTGITVDATDPANPIVATTITQYTDEMAQDAVGNAVGNWLDYDDATGAISVDETELTHNSLGSKQGGTTNEYYHLTSAQHTIVSNTTASFTTADETKLDNITVTQAVNLDTMEADIAALANGMVYKGNWDASAWTFPWAWVAQTWWFYTVSVGGTVDSVVFNVDDRLVATTDNASTTVYAWNWTKLDATDAVTSVFGRTGNVTATNGDYTASNITNVPAWNISSVTVQNAINELDSEKQPLDAQLTSVAGLSYTGNALKVMRVNAGETDFELATISSSGATTALDNLASVAINTTLVSDTDNTDDLGTTLKKWANLFVTTIGATATRVTKGWFTDLEVTNAIAGSITGSAATLTTGRTIGTATGDVTSAGSSFNGSANNTNAYTIANSAVTLAKMADLAQDQFIGRTTASTWVPQTATITAAARTVLDDTTVAAMVDTLGGATSTGTGGLVRATSPTLVTPALGTPASGNLSNCTGIPAPSGIGWSLKEYSTATASGITSGTLDLATDWKYKILVQCSAASATSKTLYWKINWVTTANSYWNIMQGRNYDGTTAANENLDFKDSQWQFTSNGWNAYTMEFDLSILSYDGTNSRVIGHSNVSGLYQDSTEKIMMIEGTHYQTTQTNVTSINFNVTTGSWVWKMWIYQLKTS